MQRRCTITTATLAGVSANITQPSIHPVYAKCANDGYLLLQASAHGQRPKPAPGSRLNHSPESQPQFPSAPVRILFPLCPLRPLRPLRPGARALA